MRDRIEIKKELMPYTIEIALGSVVYGLYFQYNRAKDFYSVALYDSKGELICGDSKLVYGNPLWQQEYREEYPPLMLEVIDESDNESVVNKSTLGEKVFMTVDDEGK